MNGPAAAERILLVRLSSLGDVLQAMPALAGLRAARPNAAIGWLVERRFEDAVQGHPHIDRVFVFDRKKSGSLLSNAGAAWRTRRELRAWRPDVAVDLQGNLKGAMLAWLSGAPRRIGLPRGEASEGAHRLATETVAASPDSREHRSERARRLLTPLGANGSGDAELVPVDERTRSAVTSALAAADVDDGRFVLLLPGTSDFGAFKRWPALRFAALARELQSREGVPSLVGFGPGQRGLAEEIVAASDGAARLAPETRDLREVRALAERAAVVVGPDSGPLTLASLAGCPTVVLFGPKDPQIYAPRGPKTAHVWKGVYCSPCALRQCADPICMTTMSVDEVLVGIAEACGGVA